MKKETWYEYYWQSINSINKKNVTRLPIQQRRKLFFKTKAKILEATRDLFDLRVMTGLSVEEFNDSVERWEVEWKTNATAPAVVMTKDEESTAIMRDHIKARFIIFPFTFIHIYKRADILEFDQLNVEEF